MIRRSYIDLPGGQMHLRRAGEGRPLLLLHQSPSSGAMWEAVLPLLATAGFRAVAPDLPGFGMSYRPDRPPAIVDYAGAVTAAADALGFAEFDLVGHHTGASVALQVAADLPDRVSRLALWGVPLIDEAYRKRLRDEVPPVYDPDGAALAAAWVRRRGLAGPAYSPELGVRCLLEVLQMGPALTWGHWAVAELDHAALLARIRQPTLVMAGELDPVWDGSRRAATLLRDGRFVAIEGAGLDVVDQFPQRFAECVIAFLRA